MSVRLTACLLVLLSCRLLTAAESAYKATQLDKPVAGLSDTLAGKIDAKGYEVTGPDGAVCRLWFVKQLSVQPGFKSSQTINYPFTPGQLLGVLQVVDGGGFTDFRQEELEGGLYTLRYGQQPEDGNHIGTSETADFFMALPVALDLKPDPITDTDEINEKSAEAASSGPPAILSLLPVAKAPAKLPAIEHDEDNEFWILTVRPPAKKGAIATSIPLRFVVVGYADE